MFIGEQNIGKTLFNRLSLLKFCSKLDKNKIFYTTIENDLRYLNSSIEKSRITNLLDQWRNDISNSELLKQIINEKIGFDLNHIFFKKDLSINETNWQSKVWGIMDNIQKILPNEDVFIKSLIRNYWLIKQGLCPFINYAFGKWQLSFSKKPIQTLKDIELQAELSTVYLFRIVELQNHNNFPLKNLIKSTGAYSFVFHNENKNKVYKVPKNLAAKAFINHQEALLTKKLMRTRLKNNIPAIYEFNIESGIIKREFIKGILGDDLLKKQDLQQDLVTRLNDFYNLLLHFSSEENIMFDLHPGNFIWSTEKQRWFLIDLGPVAQIGSDYYPLHSFEKYFKKIWLERQDRMIYEPIRSVSIDTFIN
jgi:hypothetical protein